MSNSYENCPSILKEYSENNVRSCGRKTNNNPILITIDVLLRVIIEVYGLLHCIPEVCICSLTTVGKKTKINIIFLDFVFC